MDFILSLAHFCELHGPTSVLCTQVLPFECASCLPTSPSSFSPSSHSDVEPASYFSRPQERRPNSAGHGTLGISDGDRCASCRMSLPDDSQIVSENNKKVFKDEKDRHPLRTREDVHVCNALDAGFDDEDSHFHFPPASMRSANSDASCHNHRLDYISSPSPGDSDTFSSLRRATIRTLSGEQLPRGQTSGPLWFGDSVSGYTIAYVFRLADMHARGRQRYYALLALAGNDPQRAFESCTMIWAFFEQIAMHIVRTAEEVSTRSALEDSPPDRGQITPISSFLTGRTMDPDGFPRRGVANVRANGIAELVDNDNFFAELHVMFVGILQELGRLLGGMRVKPAVEVSVVGETEEQSQSCSQKSVERSFPPATSDKGKLSTSSATNSIRFSTPMPSPTIVSHRQTVVV